MGRGVGECFEKYIVDIFFQPAREARKSWYYLCLLFLFSPKLWTCTYYCKTVLVCCTFSPQQSLVGLEKFCQEKLPSLMSEGDYIWKESTFIEPRLRGCHCGVSAEIRYIVLGKVRSIFLIRKIWFVLFQVAGGVAGEQLGAWLMAVYVRCSTLTLMTIYFQHPWTSFASTSPPFFVNIHWGGIAINTDPMWIECIKFDVIIFSGASTCRRLAVWPGEETHHLFVLLYSYPSPNIALSCM